MTQAAPDGKYGLIKDAVLWSPVDIDYAALCITKAQLDGTLDAAKGVVKARRSYAGFWVTVA